MIPVRLYRKSLDGIDIAVPTSTDAPTCFYVGVTGGRLKKEDAALATASEIQSQLESLGFEMVGERSLDGGCVVEMQPSDVMVVINGPLDSRFREMVAESVGSNPDWGLVESFDGITVVGVGANPQTIIGILGAAMRLQLQVMKPESTSEDLEEVPICKGGKEMVSFFGRDLLLGEHHRTSVKAGLVATPTVFTVGRSLVTF
jgi:hypothetical protein